MGISQGMHQVRSRTKEGVVGGLYRQGPNDETRTGLNQSPQAVQITTVTVTDQGDDDDLIITIDDEDITVNSDTGLTLAEVADLLVDAINQNPVARGKCEASFDTATLTLTGNYPGQTFDVSIANDPDSWLSAVTAAQAADEADPIPFGRCVISQGFVEDEDDELVAIAKSSLLTAQVITISVAYVATETLDARVYAVRGGRKELIGHASTISATDRDTTLDALITALNADLAANSVVVTADNAAATALVFTAEIAGLEIDAEIENLGGGASDPAIARTYTTGPNESTSIHRALRGISRHSSSDPSPTIGSGTGEYAGNAGVIYLKRGAIWVDDDDVAVDRGDPIYVELGVAADNGKLFTTSSSTRVRLSDEAFRWIRRGSTASDALAALELKL